MPRGKTRQRDGIYQRKGRPGWFISYIDASGRRRQRKAKGCYTLDQARAALANEQRRVDKARTYGMMPPGEESFRDVASRFLAHQRARLTKPAFIREEGILESHLCSFFSGRLADVRRADVQRYVTQRSAKISAGSVVKELNVLKHLFALAIDWELTPQNPAQGVKSPRVPAGRVRYLQPTELRVLLGACPEWLRPIVIVAVATGMRRGEILALRWLDADRGGRRLMLPQTKNGEGRIVYLNRLALQVLNAMSSEAAKPSDLIFPQVTPSQVSVAFRRATKSAKIDDFRFHDLRHTAASWMRMQGADIHTVAQLLGHKDLRMAARYQHLSPAFLAEAVSRLDSVFQPLDSESSLVPFVTKALPRPETAIREAS